jgi:hypothetical protein
VVVGHAIGRYTLEAQMSATIANGGLVELEVYHTEQKTETKEIEDDDDREEATINIEKGMPGMSGNDRLALRDQWKSLFFELMCEGV